MKTRRAARDPETRRSIRRLELQLQETQSAETGERILNKLIALYSELGDARGVIRYRTLLKRLQAGQAQALRKKSRRSHRVPRGPRGYRPAPHVRRENESSRYCKYAELDKIWSNGDVTLGYTGLKDAPFSVIHCNALDSVMEQRFFKTREEADAYIFTRHGVISRENDPDGRDRHRRRRRVKRDPVRKERIKKIRRIRHARRKQRAANLKHMAEMRREAHQDVLEAHELEKEASRRYSQIKHESPHKKKYEERLSAALDDMTQAMARKMWAIKRLNALSGGTS